MAYHTQSENPQVANRSGIAKKVKVGFDKIPAPLIETFPELVDIQGLPLTDVAGNRLITSVITTFAVLIAKLKSGRTKFVRRFDLRFCHYSLS